MCAWGYLEGASAVHCWTGNWDTPSDGHAITWEQEIYG